MSLIAEIKVSGMVREEVEQTVCHNSSSGLHQHDMMGKRALQTLRGNTSCLLTLPVITSPKLHQRPTRISKEDWQ